jgi:hypothetical protein
MNREELFSMADKSHLDVYGLGTNYAKFADALEAFAALVAKHTLANIDPSSFMSWQEGYEAGKQTEREAIAQMIEDAPALMEFAQNDQGGCLMCGFTPKLAAKTIRTRDTQ